MQILNKRKPNEIEKYLKLINVKNLRLEYRFNFDNPAQSCQMSFLFFLI